MKIKGLLMKEHRLIEEMVALLKHELKSIEPYSKHIETEDKHFFLEVMNYFSDEKTGETK